MVQNFGILRHKTIPYKMMNKTLFDKVKCMMVGSGVPKVLWGQTTVTVTYIVNRAPSSALEGKTSEEKGFGKLLDYSHLRVFMCTGFFHQNLGKLEPRT